MPSRENLPYLAIMNKRAVTLNDHKSNLYMVFITIILTNGKTTKENERYFLKF